MPTVGKKHFPYTKKGKADAAVAALADHDFVASGAFTMADIPLGAYAYRWFSMLQPRPDLPNLAAWYDRLCARLAFQAHVQLPIASA